MVEKPDRVRLLTAGAAPRFGWRRELIVWLLAPYPVRYSFRVMRQTIRRWRLDRCAQEAAALAYKTALCLVPFCAVAFTLLKAAGKLDERGAFVEFFSKNLFPAEDQANSVTEAI